MSHPDKRCNQPGAPNHYLGVRILSTWHCATCYPDRAKGQTPIPFDRAANSPAPRQPEQSQSTVHVYMSRPVSPVTVHMFNPAPSITVYVSKPAPAFFTVIHHY